MKVVEETITVLCDGERPGMTLFMGGYRVALTMEEARSLASRVSAALSDAPGGGAAAQAAAADECGADRAAIVANVTDQVISWAQISDAVQRK